MGNSSETETLQNHDEDNENKMHENSHPLNRQDGQFLGNGYLWMCIACENHPTFDTVQQLFNHKKNHNFTEERENFLKPKSKTLDSLSITNISEASLDLRKNKCIELENAHSKQQTYLDTHVQDVSEPSRPLSPSSSISSDDMPLASLVGDKLKKPNFKTLNLNFKNDHKNFFKCSDKKKVKGTKKSFIITTNVISKKFKSSQTSSDIENCDSHSVKLTENIGNVQKDVNQPVKLKTSTKDDKVKKKVKHVCKICNTEFPSRFALSTHKKTHLFEDTGCYKCETCGKMYPKYDNFTRHLTIHYTNRKKTHQCNQCFASFYNLADLKKHLVLHSAVKPFRCEDCGEGFIRQDSLLIHAYKHTGIQYKKFACKDCDKVLNSPSALVMHSKTHSAKTVFCPEPGCKFSCYLQSQLRQHIRKHSGEKPFQCAKCGRCFARSNDMKNHVMSVHEGVRPYKCPSCPKEFALVGNLKIHVITHTNERPYLCAQCGKSFNQSSTLRKHSIIMHNPWRSSLKQNKNNKLSSNDSKLAATNKSTFDLVLSKNKTKEKDFPARQTKGSKFAEEKIIECKTPPVEKSYYLNDNKVGVNGEFITENLVSFTSSCTPIVQQISQETEVQVPQIAVNLPIQLDHSQAFLLPAVILESGIIRTND